MSASLISRHPDGHVLGITAGIDSNHVVVSVIKDGVHVHSIHDGKLIRTYPLGSNNGTLCNPVVADPDTNSYFAALRDVSKSMDYLVTWEASAVNVPPLSDISPRIPVDGRIEALHLLQLADSSSAVVVLANGSVAVPRWNDFTLQFLSTKPPKSTTVHSSASKDTLLVISRPAAGDLVVETFTLTHLGVSKAAGFTLPAPASSNPARVLSAVCTSSTVACLWSSGDLHIYRQSSAHRPYKQALSYHIHQSLLASSTRANSSPTTPGSSGRKRKAPHSSEPNATHPGIALLPLDNSRLLLAATTPASPGHLALSTLDTRYGCTLSESLLPLPSPPAAPHTHALTLTSARDALIVSTAGHTYHLTLDIPSADLSNMLGKLSVLTPSTSPIQVLSPQDLSQRCIPPSTVLATPHHIPLSTHRQQEATARAFTLQPAAPSSQTPPSPSPASAPSALAPPAAPAATSPAVTPAGLQLGATTPNGAVVKRAKQQQRAGDQASSILAAMLQQQRGVATGGPQQHTEAASSSGTPAATPPAAAASGKLLDRACRFLSECTAARTEITAPLPQLVATQLAEAGRWEQLVELLAARPLQSLYDCSGALEALVGAHQHALVAQLCRQVRELQPAAIAAALEQLLSPREGAGAACKQHRDRLRSIAAAAVQEAEDAPDSEHSLAAAQWAAAAVDGFSAREVCMHALMAVPLDAMEIVAAARQLRGRQVQQLLQYLSKWVQKHDELGFGSLPEGVVLDELLVVPSARQVLDWMTSLLDAHLALLVLHGGDAKGLQGVGRVVRKQLAGALGLIRMRGTAAHMLGGGKLPASVVERAANYTVEVLDLRVF